MNLATVRVSGQTRAARLDVGELLTRSDSDDLSTADGPAVALRHVDYAPLIPRPGKILCVGLNYRRHILEMGRALPAYPTVFAKFADSLIGANDDILSPPETTQLDWEGELAIVVGSTVRRADEHSAATAIAGFAVLNDVTCRDWQYRTMQWLQGKCWEASTPLGPWLVTPDEVGGCRPALELRTLVDGEVVQAENTADLVFDPVHLVSYLSTMMTLRPGDVIATGTPGGVGHGRTPPVHLAPGQRLVTEIEGLDRTTNLVVAER